MCADGIVHTSSNSRYVWSSARHVSGTVESRNERNPCRLLQVSDETAEATRRKVRMTSNQRGLYALGYTRGTMDATTGREAARRSKSHQKRPQFGLEAAICLHEAGIASNRGSERRGEYVLWSCTHNESAGQIVFLNG
jgi:hypothetical protein